MNTSIKFPLHKTTSITSITLFLLYFFHFIYKNAIKKQIFPLIFFSTQFIKFNLHSPSSCLLLMSWETYSSMVSTHFMAFNFLHCRTSWESLSTFLPIFFALLFGFLLYVYKLNKLSFTIILRKSQVIFMRFRSA